MWSIRYRQNKHLGNPRYGSTKVKNKNDLQPLRELSSIYGYHQDYLSSLIRSEQIEGVKVGRGWCTTPAAIEAYISHKKYYLLRDALKPYYKDIALLVVGIFLISFAGMYWYMNTSVQAPDIAPARSEISSDLDIPVSYSQ